MTSTIRVAAAVSFAAVFALLVACGDDVTGPAPATQLAFTIQPAHDTVGSPMATVSVTAMTAQGSTATGFTGTVTLALGANPGGAGLSGTLSAAATAGVAQFPNVVLNKAEDGYTLTATSGSLNVTSAPFDIAEVSQRYAIRYYWGLDLETGASQNCDIGAPPCPATHDFRFAYNGTTPVHSRLFHYSARQIVHLIGRTYASVHLADTAGVVFGTSLIDQPFDNTRTVLLRTDGGNVYKLGNPTEFGASGADSVRFHAARLN